MNRLKFVALAAMALTLFATTCASANVLSNPGFEDDAVPDAEPTPFVNGWTAFNGATTASASLDPVRTGIGSLRLAGPGGFTVPGAFQIFPANPGEIWDLQGYMLTPDALPTDITFGLLKIVFGDGTKDLAPGEILIGQAAPTANPGIESLPFLNSASTPNTWQFTQARGVAPAGTVEVKMFALMVDQSAGTGYFDDLVATTVTDEGMLGDFNDNGVVDAADYTIWRNNQNAATDDAIHNNGDQVPGINGGDYAVWKANFAPGGSGAAVRGGAGVVPEPGTLFLACMTIFGCGLLRRGR